MKVESIIFGVIAFASFVAAIVYGIWSQEPIGTTALALSGGLCALIGGFFWFVSRRIEPRPEDRKDAEMADGAGELGFFSPWSWWPIVLAGSGALMFLGLAVGFWIAFIGGALLLIAIVGWVYEYYRGYFAR